jgi:hypothetical protein
MQLTLQNLVFLHYPKYLKNKFANNWLFSVRIELLRRNYGKLMPFLFLNMSGLKTGHDLFPVEQVRGISPPACQIF